MAWRVQGLHGLVSLCQGEGWVPSEEWRTDKGNAGGFHITLRFNCLTFQETQSTRPGLVTSVVTYSDL